MSDFVTTHFLRNCECETPTYSCSVIDPLTLIIRAICIIYTKNVRLNYIGTPSLVFCKDIKERAKALNVPH